MAMIKVKGYEFNAVTIRDSFSRRALKFKNNIVSTLRGVGLTEDDVNIELEPVAIRNVPASASWYVDGFHLHYSYQGSSKYVENLYVVFKVIEFEVKAVVNGTKTIEQFIRDFTEEKDVEKERKKARELIGVEADSLDLDLINKKYKKLAKDAHPDMPNGDTETFKALNRAHKILKRELE
ncbi:MAG: hypothetical protein ACI8Y7_000129 [Candidatus Woesearchaeota archaeon]|jgi:hypothetical protein